MRRTIGTDLGIVPFLATEDRCLALAPLTEVTRSPSGSVSLGVLATMLTFARLPRRAAPGMEDYDPRKWVGRVRPTEPPAPGGAPSRSPR